MMGGVALRLAPGGAINVDLVNLLPESARAPDLEAVIEKRRKEFERHLILLVEADSPDKAQSAEKAVRDALEGQSFLEEISPPSRAEQEAGFAFYAQHRHGLAGPAMRRTLESGDADKLVETVARAYANPAGFLSSDLIETDPLLLLPDFLENTLPDVPATLRMEKSGRYYEWEGRFYMPLYYLLAQSPFSLDGQAAFSAALERAQEELSRKAPDARLYSVGVARHAARGAAQARSEISTVGLGSLAGVVLLVVCVFRSALPLLAAVLTIGIGVMAGLAACLFIFGEIHLLTLVFGGSLVGISVDYVFHFLCEKTRPGTPVTGEAALSKIFPGISLGLATTLIGFAGMWLAPFPGLRQMAMFSAAGLIASYLTVCLWFPHLPLGTRAVAPAVQRAIEHYAAFWRKMPRMGWLGGLAGTTLILLAGITQLTPQDDVRLLQTLDPDVVAEQAQIEQVLDQKRASQYLIVAGRSTEELLAREEQLRSALQETQTEELLSLSRFVPSQEKQQKTRRKLIGFLDKENIRSKLQETVGLRPQTLSSYLGSLKEAGPALTLEAWLESAASTPYRHLYLGVRGGLHRSVIELRQVGDVEALMQLTSGIEGAELVDTAGTYSRLFGEYRRQLMVLAALSYILVVGLLFWKYGGKAMILIMAPPVAAALAALGLLGLTAGSFSLFHIMALILVLGIGVDYGIFFKEAGAQNAATMLAVLLSALTTVLAFGLLAFSQTAAIHAFGVTVFTGIVAAALVATAGGVYLTGDGGNGAS
jgi:predicted exporter